MAASLSTVPRQDAAWGAPAKTPAFDFDAPEMPLVGWVPPPNKPHWAPLEPANRSAQSVLSAETVTIASSDIGRADRPFPISSQSLARFSCTSTRGLSQFQTTEHPPFARRLLERPKSRTQSTPWRCFLFCFLGGDISHCLSQGLLISTFWDLHVAPTEASTPSKQAQASPALLRIIAH